jgi:hypothetical protein
MFNFEFSELSCIQVSIIGPHPILVLVMKIGIGKVNKENPLFGRVIQHANEELCPVGSYAFMLLSRFDVAGDQN